MVELERQPPVWYFLGRRIVGNDEILIKHWKDPLMFIKKIEKDTKKKFVFVLRKPDGSEYEKAVFAINETEAEQRLTNALDIFKSVDEVVNLLRPSNEK